MKMDMEAKPMGEDMPDTNEGDYSQEHLDCMLENFLQAKKIEQDPKLFALLKDYALSKNKMVAELFDVNRVAPPKSLKDLKAKADKMLKEEAASED